MNRHLFSPRTAFFILIYIGAMFAGTAFAQDIRGQITGRVVGTDETPVAGATVLVRPITADTDVFQAPTATATTDGAGAFTLSDLSPRLYRLEVTAKGYATPEKPVRARIGANLTIALTRGGVITGQVTDRENRPIVEAQIKVIRIADADGKPIPNPVPPRYPGCQSDDRGVYRRWGLTPGRYLVWVEGTPSVYLPLDPLEGDVPTYYPSVTRGGAKEVVVTEGGETTGIDIRHRGQRGFAVSGQTVGASQDTFVDLRLLDAETHAVIAQAAKDQLRGPDFTFTGIPPGVYDLVADAYLRKGDHAFCEPIRVVVKTKDVEGLTVTLVAAATVSGKVGFTSPGKERTDACKVEPPAPVEETSVQLIRKRENPLAPDDSSPVVPEEKGSFRLTGVRPGDCALAVEPPAGWYVATATEPASPKPKPLGQFTLKKGASLDGVVLSLEFGAAELRGTVASLPKSPEAVEKLRVHLIPLDEEQVENPARFYETTVAASGAYEFRNLAPGRYAVVVLKKDVPEGDNPAFPVAADPVKRKTLRAAAKDAKTIELAPCRPVEDFKVEVKP